MILRHWGAGFHLLLLLLAVAGQGDELLLLVLLSLAARHVRKEKGGRCQLVSAELSGGQDRWFL